MKTFDMGFSLFAKKNGICAMLFTISLVSTVNSQIANYVINPSFELAHPQATSNPFAGAQYWMCTDSMKSTLYLFTTRPPLSNAPHCISGYQFPRTGDNFALVQFYCHNCVSYAQRFSPVTRLIKTLKTGVTYCGKYYVVNTNYNAIASDSYQMFFGDDSIDTIKVSSGALTYLNPQISYTGGIITDTLNWTAISGTFVAKGNEKFLIVGNFKTDAQTNTLALYPTANPMSNDVYIDDVSVFEMDMPAYAGPDKPFFAGDSVFIGIKPEMEFDDYCIWYKLPGVTPIDTIAGLWVKPTETSTYVVRQQLWCSGVKWDTVVVYKDGVGLEKLKILENELSIYPSPANDFIQVQSQNSSSIDQIVSYELFNNLGINVRKEVFGKDQSQSRTISVGGIPAGSYYLKLQTKEGFYVNKPFVIRRD
jgi:hypothetical protein